MLRFRTCPLFDPWLRKLIGGCRKRCGPRASARSWRRNPQNIEPIQPTEEGPADTKALVMNTVYHLAYNLWIIHSFYLTFHDSYLFSSLRAFISAVSMNYRYADCRFPMSPRSVTVRNRLSNTKTDVSRGKRSWRRRSFSPTKPPEAIGGPQFCIKWRATSLQADVEENRQFQFSNRVLNAICSDAFSSLTVRSFLEVMIGIPEGRSKDTYLGALCSPLDFKIIFHLLIFSLWSYPRRMTNCIRLLRPGNQYFVSLEFWQGAGAWHVCGH